MVNYPQLSASQQQNLPKLKQLTPLPARFDDSTHQLWHCDTIDGEMMLKVCDVDNVKQSSFWQGMALLFNADLPAQLGEFSAVYSVINEHSPLRIPEYIASSSNVISPQKQAFILNQFIAGSMIETHDIDDAMVIDLAQHMAQLHQHSTPIWGTLLAPKYRADQWSQRLQYTLKTLAENQAAPKVLLADALAQCATIEMTHFVPIMLDLRWDQFLHQAGKLTTLVDLDAFVYAPKALELVLLDYILTVDQRSIFMAEYHTHHEAVDLSSVRTAYRLLLFLMNVLGERDLDVWMAQPFTY